MEKPNVICCFKYHYLFILTFSLLSQSLSVNGHTEPQPNASHSNLKTSNEINLWALVAASLLRNSETVNTQSFDSCRLRANWKRLPRGHCNKQSLLYKGLLPKDLSFLYLHLLRDEDGQIHTAY